MRHRNAGERGLYFAGRGVNDGQVAALLVHHSDAALHRQDGRGGGRGQGGAEQDVEQQGLGSVDELTHDCLQGTGIRVDVRSAAGVLAPDDQRSPALFNLCKAPVEKDNH